jgi:starvation-inducible DNA-binding protein
MRTIATKDRSMTAKLNRSRNDLPLQTREEMISLLNQRLAEVIDLGLQSKQAHWNVNGPHFIGLHELFDRVAGQVGEFSDEIAERAVALGGTAYGTIQAIAGNSDIPAYPLGPGAGRDHVNNMAEALAVVGERIREAIETATDVGDADTADLFTAVSRGIDKLLWMVEAHNQADD